MIIALWAVAWLLSVVFVLVLLHGGTRWDERDEHRFHTPPHVRKVCR